MIGFIKGIFSSCLGVLLAMVVVVFLIIGVGSALGSLSQGPVIGQNSVLHLRLDNITPERTNNLPMGMEFLMEENIWGIHELGYAIEKAADDHKIKALVIEPGIATSFVHMDILRNSIRRFKASGKPVYAYSDYYNQVSYYLSSVADRIYLNPLGQAELKGFAVVEPFMKDALASIGVEMEVYYAGDFKSATEPFRRNNMSQESKLQLREFISELYDQYLDTIAESRSLDLANLNEIVNTYASRDARDAKQLGLVDVVGYDSDLARDLKESLGISTSESLNLVDLGKYRTSAGKKRNYSADSKIAIVYMEGEFRSGKHHEGTITADEYVPLLRKIRSDDKIDAVVLRINSPGGNAVVADKILNEIKLIKSNGKKVVASMGDLAASGGYYVAANSDSIFASRHTITGSIGVFAMFPNFNKLVTDKMGIFMDSVSTSPYAGLGNLLLPRSEKEKAIFQESTDSIYLTFLDIVSEGREMSRDEVHAVAQGRIWTGAKAMDLGLIDKIGGLPSAIDAAAALAGVEDYRIVEYPIAKTPLQRLSEELNSDNYIDRKISSVSPELSSIQHLLSESNKVQAWMPYSFILN